MDLRAAGFLTSCDAEVRRRGLELLVDLETEQKSLKKVEIPLMKLSGINDQLTKLFVYKTLCACTQQESRLLALNSLQKDLSHPDTFVRFLATRAALHLRQPDLHTAFTTAAGDSIVALRRLAASKIFEYGVEGLFNDNEIALTSACRLLRDSELTVVVEATNQILELFQEIWTSTSSIMLFVAAVPTIKRILPLGHLVPSLDRQKLLKLVKLIADYADELRAPLIESARKCLHCADFPTRLLALEILIREDLCDDQIVSTLCQLETVNVDICQVQTIKLMKQCLKILRAKASSALKSRLEYDLAIFSCAEPQSLMMAKIDCLIDLDRFPLDVAKQILKSCQDVMEFWDPKPISKCLKLIKSVLRDHSDSVIEAVSKYLVLRHSMFISRGLEAFQSYCDVLRQVCQLHPEPIRLVKLSKSMPPELRSFVVAAMIGRNPLILDILGDIMSHLQVTSCRSNFVRIDLMARLVVAHIENRDEPRLITLVQDLGSDLTCADARMYADILLTLIKSSNSLTISKPLPPPSQPIVTQRAHPWAANLADILSMCDEEDRIPLHEIAPRGLAGGEYCSTDTVSQHSPEDLRKELADFLNDTTQIQGTIEELL